MIWNRGAEANSLPAFNYDFAIYIQVTDGTTPDQIATLRAELDEMFERQHEFVQPIRESADAKEGALAFVEKREPRFTNR
mgnify:CR=1 FL=1